MSVIAGPLLSTGFFVVLALPPAVLIALAWSWLRRDGWWLGIVRVALATYVVVLICLLFCPLPMPPWRVPEFDAGLFGSWPYPWANIYTLIPVWNLIKVPGMVQDALYRVEPRAGGFFMVFAAWFGLVGSWIVSFLGSWFIGIALVKAVLNAPTRPDAVEALQSSLDQSFALEIVTSAMVVIGALILVLLMVRIERRCAARDAEVRAVALVPAAA